jgi:hypothetical protein
MVIGEIGERVGEWLRDRDRDLEGEKNLLNAIVFYCYVLDM